MASKSTKKKWYLRRRYLLLIASPLILIFLLGGGLYLHETYYVGFVAGPEELARYPFGAEGPVAGMPAYRSPEDYAFHSFIRGSLSLLVGSGTLFSIWKRSALGGIVTGILLLLFILWTPLFKFWESLF